MLLVKFFKYFPQALVTEIQLGLCMFIIFKLLKVSSVQQN
jgi:hypothetical protein